MSFLRSFVLPAMSFFAFEASSFVTLYFSIYCSLFSKVFKIATFNSSFVFGVLVGNRYDDDASC